MAGGPHLSHDHVTVQPAVERDLRWMIVGIAIRRPLHAHQAVLLSVVKPVARPARPYNPLELVRFDPDDLIYSFVAPQLQTLKKNSIL